MKTQTPDEKAAKKAERAEKRAARRDRADARVQAAAAKLAELNMNASFAGWSLSGGSLSKGITRHDVAGATATLDTGAPRKRMTATRVIGGGVAFGPAGAIVGGLARKNKSRCYVTIELATGDVILIDEHVKEEPSARAFAAKINAAGRRYANES